MPPNLLNMLLSWAALLALFAALATATPVNGNALFNGNPLFDLSLINDLRVNSSLIPTNNLSIADDHGNICGVFSTADQNNILFPVLYGDGNEHPFWKQPDCTVPARTCRRRRCFNTSALYICNDNFHTVNPTCDEVNTMAIYIVSFCCGHGEHPPKKTGISGQRFQNEQGWNVVIAYGNCRHGEYSDYPSMGGPDDPWGPNGSCFSK